MKIVRKPEWHQDTPRMQVVALLSAAQGHAMNAEDGIDPIVQAKKALVFMEQAQEILHQMPEAGEWDKPWQKPPKKMVHDCALRDRVLSAWAAASPRRSEIIKGAEINRSDSGSWVLAIPNDGGPGTLDIEIEFCPFCSKEL